jgi:hypothetical protein
LKIIKAFAITVGVAALTSVVLFLLGLAASLLGNMGWIHLGEYQPWLPIAGLEYGFPLGIMIGVVLGARKRSTPEHPDCE